MRRASFALIVSAALCCAALSPAQQTVPATEPVDDSQSVMAPTPVVTPIARPIFVTIPAALEPIKRAPVVFWHDKHTEALKTEGCEVCHAKNNDKFDFAFPKTKNEKSRAALTESFHDACITCHADRSSAHKSFGPVTCGECHADKKAFQKQEYLPVMQSQYDALKDPYHKDCTACHLKPTRSAAEVEALDWKTFYVRAQKRIEQKWPGVEYDYITHDKHVKALENKCELCHYMSPALQERLATEGKKPTSQDWLREEESGRSLKKKESAHVRCINCHLERDGLKKAHGPVECKDCHSDRQRTAKEFETVARPDYDKKEEILIHAEKATMPAVPFDHKSHIAASRSCDDCHHATLEACVKCHTQTGSKEGGFITLAESYHKIGSTLSCVGCHEREKAKPDCAGCHNLRGERLTACGTCHTGKLETLDEAVKLPAPTTLFPTNLADELVISILTNRYEPTRVKHRAIAQKLTDISNNSRLATAFHKKETTICEGCHHMGDVEKNKAVPACAACHTVLNNPSGNTANLMGAYHQACLGCHQKMGYPEKAMPQACTGCHKENKTAGKAPRL